MPSSVADGSLYKDVSGLSAESSRDAPFATVGITSGGAPVTSITANGNSDDYFTAGRGLDVYIYISALTGTSPTVTFTVQGKDPVSGQHFTMLTSAALSATGFTHLQVAPGIAVTSNVTASLQMTNTWRLGWTVGGTTPNATVQLTVLPLP